jgi:hypothetical protein
MGEEEEVPEEEKVSKENDVLAGIEDVEDGAAAATPGMHVYVGVGVRAIKSMTSISVLC